MRQVILPYNAQIIHNGKLFVNELVPGDLITGYDLRNKMLKSVSILEITPLEVAKKLLLLQVYNKPVCFVDETVCYTPHGEKSLAERPINFIGFCRHNPKVLTLRTRLNVLDFPGVTIPAFLLKWDSPDYIWSEGILVGSAG